MSRGRPHADELPRQVSGVARRRRSTAYGSRTSPRPVARGARAPGRSRTRDILFTREALYRLSYRGVHGCLGLPAASTTYLPTLRRPGFQCVWHATGTVRVPPSDSMCTLAVSLPVHYSRLPSLPALTTFGRALASRSTGRPLHRREDSNLQHAALETAALPVELRPFGVDRLCWMPPGRRPSASPPSVNDGVPRSYLGDDPPGVPGLRGAHSAAVQGRQCQAMDSNHRPPAYETGALPTELARQAPRHRRDGCEAALDEGERAVAPGSPVGALRGPGRIRTSDTRIRNPVLYPD